MLDIFINSFVVYRLFQLIGSLTIIQGIMYGHIIFLGRAHSPPDWHCESKSRI